MKNTAANPMIRPARDASRLHFGKRARAFSDSAPRYHRAIGSATLVGGWFAVRPALCHVLGACEEADAVLAILVKVAES